MKPLETVQVLAWLTHCRTSLEHYLKVAEDFRRQGLDWNVKKCMTVVHTMNLHMVHARSNYVRLTWEGGAA